MKNFPENKKSIIYIVTKRVLDVLLASLVLVLLSPILLLIAVIIVATSEGPIFYRGVRTGRFGKSFRLLKFRTMVSNADKIGGPSTGKNHPRVTRVGKFLTASKLDEMPNLINVIKGEMSLVGPRPEVPQYTEIYTPEELIILTVRPGITDYSSLHFLELSESLGQSDVDYNYETKVKPIKNLLRIKYAKECSLWVDLKILFFTVIKILFKFKYKSPLEKSSV